MSRGHASSIETDPNGNQTEHRFYQGEAANHCTPTGTLDPCFGMLRNTALTTGKEYETISRGASGSHDLTDVKHIYTSVAYDMGGLYTQPLSGIWRGFNYESQTVNTSWAADNDNGVINWTSKVMTDSYLYETSGVLYGRMLSHAQYDANNVRTRKTNHLYNTNVVEGGAFIVDRKSEEDILDSSSRYLAVALYAYDGLNVGQVGTKGSLTRMVKFYDVPLATSIQSVSLHGSDATYGYDAAYGNQATFNTFTSPVTATLSGSTWTLTGAGAGGTTRTTTTNYDATFHSFPIQMTHPTVGGVTLTAQAGYDYRMGVMNQTIDYNNNITTAGYDSFGRMLRLVKPGDSDTIPTVQAVYSDTAQPFQYTVSHLETAGVGGANRPTQLFYDGIGQQIQTKNESQGPNGEENIVTDKVYNGLGQSVKETQARYVSNTTCSYASYCPLPTTGIYSTTTGYDALGRPIVITDTDGTKTNMIYWTPSSSIGPATTTIDAKSHKQQSFYDVYGRLIQVKEFSGTNPWTTYATTSYTYSPLDLLTDVYDNASNHTTMVYDSLGRKTSMTDPDMGAYSYAYDSNGNLKQQTDGRGDTITFGYDLLDRLTQKSYNYSGTTAYYYYDDITVTNGKGQRTGMARGSVSTTWNYDTRGRTSQAHSIFPASAANSTTQWSYDSADRINTITYPNGEQVSYTYDNGWRPNRMYSGGVPTNCYICNAHYSALDQPLDETFGNGVVQTYTYNNPKARLSKLQVGTPGGGYGNYFSRSYGYDNVGNVSSITNNFTGGETQTYTYDHLDRLTNWDTSTGVHEIYQFDTLGNLTSKAGTSYTYGTSGNSSCHGPHQVCTAGSQTFSYDAVGNQFGGGRTIGWNADNQPTSITVSGKTENYTYDADGERVIRTTGSGTYYYVGSLYEVDNPGAGNETDKSYYQFGGQIVAQTNAGTLVATYYLHGDHLGSVGLTTDASGNVASSEEYKPWGEVRSGGVSQTELNYTGQRKDSTGLLYYHSRYYDPALARFISADSIVPSAAFGAGGALGTLNIDGKDSIRGLTSDFHEGSLVNSLNQENQLAFQKGFYFQLSKNDKKKAKTPYGPLNPQALNRYSYVLNNPLRYTDPTGHTWYLSHDDAIAFAAALDAAGDQLQANGGGIEFGESTLGLIAELLGSEGAWLYGTVAGLLGMAAYGAAAAAFKQLASYIRQFTGANGVAIAYDADGVYGDAGAFLFVNLDNGDIAEYLPSYAFRLALKTLAEQKSSILLGAKPWQSKNFSGHWWHGWHFEEDATNWYYYCKHNKSDTSC